MYTMSILVTITDEQQKIVGQADMVIKAPDESTIESMGVGYADIVVREAWKAWYKDTHPPRTRI